MSTHYRGRGRGRQTETSSRATSSAQSSAGRGAGPSSGPSRPRGQGPARGPLTGDRGGYGRPADEFSAGRGAGPTRPRAQGPYRGPSGPPFRARGRPADGVIFLQDRPPRALDARIQDDSDKAVVAGLGDTRANDLPLRPDFGTQGRPVVLRANYFPVRVDGAIYRYRAEIEFGDTKKTVTRRVKQRVFSLAERTEEWARAGMVGRVAHDGAEKLVASMVLPEDPLTISGVYYDDNEQPPAQGGAKYTLTLTFLEEVDQEILKECLGGKPVDSQALAKVLSAVNLVLTARPSETGTKVGRDDETKKHPDQRLFFGDPEPKDIGGGLIVREGFYVSARPAHQQLMVNVNTCHAAFYKPQNFATAMDEYRRFVVGDTGAFGKQVRVSTQPNGHIVMIQGISKRNALEHKFKHNDFGFVTIAKYYELKHSIKLVQPHLPLLEGPKGSFYPPEICKILADQGFKGELTDRKHAKGMLDVACKLPKENANEIVNRGLNLLKFDDSNPLLNSFGIHVEKEMAVVPGRVLDKPGLSYSSAKPASIDMRASWNLRGVKFAEGARLERWATFVIKDGGRFDFVDKGEAQGIANEFRDMCNTSGMRMQPLGAYEEVQLPPRQRNDQFREDAMELIEQAMTDLVEHSQPELVLVMLSNEDKVIYNGIKRLCDVQLDVATVCMQSSKVKQPKGRPQYYANVALKVNMKMGGINHTLDANSGMWLKRARTMVMGMDVTHPAKGLSVTGTPSIVAVVASVDDRFAQYPAALALRESKVEIETEDDEDKVLRGMFIDRFELYKTRNRGRLPERVILFRDGVSESQYAQVRKYELKEMKNAFKHFGPKYDPKLSIIVCGKRHHTRFYPTEERDAAHDGNPLPGTVVDRGVTPAYEFDFFLQAHGGLKGTTRPTHYFVVHDENGFNADDLQRVTNDLSYMFARATKAVSLVSPAYWADIACERGRCYLHKLLTGGKDEEKGKDKDKKGKRRGEDSVFDRAVKLWGGGVSGRLRDTMFYL